MYARTPRLIIGWYHNTLIIINACSNREE